MTNKEHFFKPKKRGGFWYIVDGNGKYVSLDGGVFKTKVRTVVADKIAMLQYLYNLHQGKVNSEKGE